MTGELGWTDDRIATLKKLWMEGKSASEIALELGGGSTRNAVIGKVHRLKLASRPSVTQRRDPKPPKSPRPRKEGRPAMLPKRETLGRPRKENPLVPDMPTAALPGEAAWLPLEGSTPVKLEHHKDGCRWPIGDPALFCNAHVHGKGPYCETHHRRGNVPIERKKKVA